MYARLWSFKANSLRISTRLVTRDLDDFTSARLPVFYNCPSWRRFTSRLYDFYVSIRDVTYAAAGRNYLYGIFQIPKRNPRRVATSFLPSLSLPLRSSTFNALLRSLGRLLFIFEFSFFSFSSSLSHSLLRFFIFSFLFAFFLFLFFFVEKEQRGKKKKMKKRRRRRRRIRSRFLASNVNFYVLIIQHVRPWNS